MTLSDCCRRQNQGLEYDNQTERLEEEMALGELVCVLEANSGPGLSLQANSFFPSIYQDQNGFPHYSFWPWGVSQAKERSKRNL